MYTYTGAMSVLASTGKIAELEVTVYDRFLSRKSCRTPGDVVTALTYSFHRGTTPPHIHFHQRRVYARLLSLLLNSLGLNIVFT